MPPISRDHSRSPVLRLIAAIMPEWLMAKTMSRSITGRPAMSSSSDSAVTTAGCGQHVVPGRPAVLHAQRIELARGVGRDHEFARHRRAGACQDARGFRDALMIPELAAVALRPAHRNDCPGWRRTRARHWPTGALTIGTPRSFCPQLLAGRGIERDDIAEAGGDEHLAVVIGDAAAEAFGGIDACCPVPNRPNDGRHVGCSPWARGSLSHSGCAVAGVEGEDMGFGVQHVDRARRRRPAGRSGGNRRPSPCRHPVPRPGAAARAPPVIHRVGRHSRRARAIRDCL